MDFEFEAPEVAFREELRCFIDRELPEWWRGFCVEDDRAIPWTRDFCRTLAERGWLALSWPKEHGGAEASHWMQAVFREEMWAHQEPRGPQYMILSYIGPAIMRFGTEQQRRRFLPAMARGEMIWCQGFSEPGAGSDLAALATRAELDGEQFVVHGQKIWTSWADSPADWCMLLVRTDRAAAKHQGISVLLVDMKTPGITVRPILSLAGPHEFTEVFFDDVIVPSENLLGGMNEGWKVIMTALSFERLGIARYRTSGPCDRVPRTLLPEHDRRRASAFRGPRSAVGIGRSLLPLRGGPVAPVPSYIAAVERRGLDNARFDRAHPQRDVGAARGPCRPRSSRRCRAVSAGGFVGRAKGRNLAAVGSGISATIASGTLEVLKNIVAYRGLGLPKGA